MINLYPVTQGHSWMGLKFDSHLILILNNVSLEPYCFFAIYCNHQRFFLPSSSTLRWCKHQWVLNPKQTTSSICSFWLCRNICSSDVRTSTQRDEEFVSSYTSLIEHSLWMVCMLHCAATQWSSPRDIPVSPPPPLFLFWHHKTIRLLDCHGNSSLTECGRKASSGWVLNPPSHLISKRTLRGTRRNLVLTPTPRPPTYLPPTECTCRPIINQLGRLEKAEKRGRVECL